MFLDLFCIISVYLRSICEIIKRKEHYINYPICHCCEEQSGRQQWLYNEKAPNKKKHAKLGFVAKNWAQFQTCTLSWGLSGWVGGSDGGGCFFVNMNILIWFKCPGMNFEGRKGIATGNVQQTWQAFCPPCSDSFVAWRTNARAAPPPPPSSPWYWTMLPPQIPPWSGPSEVFSHCQPFSASKYHFGGQVKIPSGSSIGRSP